MAEHPADNMILRRLAPEDLPLVAGFEREIAEISFPDDPVTDLGFYERKLRQAIGDRKSEPLVGELDGRIVGWAWIAERENFITHERYGDLRSFYVVKDLHGSGVAFRLMRACMEYCAEHGLVRLVGRTSAANEAMQAVYRIYGFEPKHIVYERRVDAAAAHVTPPRDGERLSPRKRGSPRP